MGIPLGTNKLKTIRTAILPVGSPSNNGRIYSEAVLRKAARSISTHTPIYGGFKNSDSLDRSLLYDISHQVTSLEIQNNEWLVARINILDTPAGRKLLSLYETGMIEFRPSGTGMVAKDWTVTEYTLESVAAVLATETEPLTSKVKLEMKFD